MKANYHTHTTGSDGELKPEELIKLAIKKKFDVLGITDHYHHPPEFRDWGNEYYSEEYYYKLKKLKEKYSGKIKVLVNVEFDWLEDYKGWIVKEATKRKYDYRFISIHFLKIGKEYYPLDHSQELFEDMIEKSGGIKKLVESYYGEMRMAVRIGCFDVVAHFDLIKLWNKDDKYFSGEEEWYRKEVMKTLKVISKQRMKMDLNTSGLRKLCGEQYPGEWIIWEAKKLGIKFLIGTDAHKAEELEAGLKEVGVMK